MAIWLLMTLVLSNGFKGVLLSSYINFKYELAIKSYQDLIDKKSFEIIYDNIFKITRIENSTKMILLRNKYFKGYPKRLHIETFINDEQILKFKFGQTAIICSPTNCKDYKVKNPHLNLAYTEDHFFFSFRTLVIKSTHSHAQQIRKA